MHLLARVLPSLAFLPWILVSAAEIKIGDKTFTLADGFELEQIAGPPLVNRPIVADFDELGRLYVADSSGSNDKVEKQLSEKPHRIVRLEDTDGDGRFDKSVVFADKMMFPEGVLYYDGAIYCGAPPSIWKLEDTDGDGVADKRSEWFQGKTLTGCANDLHGPYLGPDGWIYWCKGAFAQQTHERPGLGSISDSAAHLFRCRPDGSHFDSVISGGMDNPVEIAFSPEGEAFFTTTFYVNPAAGQRDALVHAIYGGTYPKIHGVIDPLKRTGDLMPAMTHLGPAAPSGLCRYASKSFGADFEGNLFSSQFNMHRVQRHILEPKGATFQTRDEDLLASDNPDFHPTDVLEDADGSLLILDTGGWYKLCCPTSQIAKPEVLGAIYRVRRKGAPRVSDPRGVKFQWARLSGTELSGLLADPRPLVQQRAIQEGASRGTNIIAPLLAVLTNSTSLTARRNAMWALTRMPYPQARESIRNHCLTTGTTTQNDSVRQIAAHAIGIWRDVQGLEALMYLLHRANPQVRRVAAQALGQIKANTAVPDLLTAAGSQTDDRVLQHSLIYALIEIADAPATRRGLQDAAGGTQRAALIALDQMEGGGLSAPQVLPLLSGKSELLRETAGWIAGRHPEWGPELVTYFKQQLKSVSGEGVAAFERQLSQFAREPAVQTMMGEELTGAEMESSRILVLNAIRQSSLKELPSVWVDGFEKALQSNHTNLLATALASLRSLPLGKTNPLNGPLTRAGRDAALPPAIRLEALALSSNPITADDDALLDFVLQNISSTQPLANRGAAANVLARSSLTERGRLQVAGSVEKIGPLELPRVLTAFHNSTNDEVGLKLLSALEQSKATGVLRAEQVKSNMGHFPSGVRERMDTLLAKLNVDGEKQRARLDELAPLLAQGDKARGHLVFNQPKVACATCHAIGYRGGQIGPDLTRIGSIRTERDLLESIVYPSSSFVRSYEPVLVATRDGEERSGLIKRESAESILVVSGPGNEQQIPRADVLDIRPSTVSIMPDGLDRQLTGQELADLIVFLKSLK